MMRAFCFSPRARRRGGFTLVMTLSILAAVTILVVGLFSIVSRERQTSASFDAVEQAELAVQAGLEQAGAMLKTALLDENGLIVAVPTAPWVSDAEAQADETGRLRSEAGRETREVLMAVNRAGEMTAGVFPGWRYVPLVSGAASSEPLPGRVADPVLQDLGQVLRPTLPGTFAGGLPTYQVAPDRAGLSADELLEAKRAAQAAAAHEPWRRTPASYWVDLVLPPLPGSEAVAEQTEQVAGRVSFYIEDLQGKVSLATAGNTTVQSGEWPGMGPYERTAPTLAQGSMPAGVAVPGLNVADARQHRLNQVSLHTLLSRDTEPALAPPLWQALHRRLVHLKPFMISPEAWKEALAQPEAALQWPGLAEREVLNQRTTAGTGVGVMPGLLIDPQARALEMHTTGGWAAYDERALIPFDAGIVDGGLPKLNLNRVLAELEEAADDGEPAKFTAEIAAVKEIADHIERHLPGFAGRKGGYPLPLQASGDAARQKAYLRCLAAGIIDYADTDALPTMDGNPLVDVATKSTNPDASNSRPAERYPSYRGVDAYPLVSEQWQRYRFEGSANNQVQLSVTQFVEVWNLTNQRIQGEVSAAYECNLSVTVGFAPPVSLNTPQGAATAVRRDFLPDARRLAADGNLPGFWHLPQTVVLEPNEVRVIAFDPVVFNLAAGGTVSAVTVQGQDAAQSDVRSRYRLAFRPQGAAGYVVVDQPLAPVERFTRTVRSNSPRQMFNTSLPGMSYALQNRNFVNNLGDPRIGFFVNYTQDVVNYENGASPWSRNFRSNIATQFFGENRVNLWPDGGHNGVARSAGVGSTDRNPSDPALRPPRHAGNDEAERWKYVQVISNTGRLQSVTELGHVFDPVMWDPNGGTEFDEPNYRVFANLRPGNVVRASDKFGGGNTLRIGRAEHERFRPDYSAFPAAGRPATRGLAAATLLDLFHTGIPHSVDEARRNGELVRIDGHINLNTATREALRAMVAGRLRMDPMLKRSSQEPQPTLLTPVALQPPSSRDFATPDASDGTAAHADLLAELIIRNRPYVSAAELADKVVMPTDAELSYRPLPPEVRYQPGRGNTFEPGQPVLGAVTRAATDRQIEPEWNDAAAEEAFARLYNSGTVRSRNFKVVVTGQAVRRTRSGQVKVLATRSRLYHVFVRPVRNAAGVIERQEIEITYARTL